jgi:hypothetical protein
MPFEQGPREPKREWPAARRLRRNHVPQTAVSTASLASRNRGLPASTDTPALSTSRVSTVTARASIRRCLIAWTIALPAGGTVPAAREGTIPAPAARRP